MLGRGTYIFCFVHMFNLNSVHAFKRFKKQNSDDLEKVQLEAGMIVTGLPLFSKS